MNDTSHLLRIVFACGLATICLRTAAADVAVRVPPPNPNKVAEGERGQFSPELALIIELGDVKEGGVRYLGLSGEGDAVIAGEEIAPLVRGRKATERFELTAEVVRDPSDLVPVGEVVGLFRGDTPAEDAFGGGWRIAQRITFSSGGGFVTLINPNGITSATLSALRGSPVRYFEPNYRYALPTDRPTEIVPSDPLFHNLWGLRAIGAKDAWEKFTEATVKVAVIDTGVDYTHPDLEGNVWRNAGEIPANGVDDDGNGFVDDVRGYDFANEDGDPIDGHSHGTHCAGTIGAVGNNGVGVVGVSWKVEIMALQIFRANGSPASQTQIARAIRYAADNGAKVLSNSWGGGAYSTLIAEAIDYAESKGCLFVAAAGNNASDNDARAFYPASYPNESIVAVMSIDDEDRVSSFSNFGATRVDIGAPGSGILSTVPGGYSLKSGTSMAAPHVSGVAALLWGKSPTLGTFRQVREALFERVRPLPALNGKCLTGGALRVLAE